jgi:hypothetical protein
MHNQPLKSTLVLCGICFILLTQYCAGDKIEKNEMGWACGTYGGRERCAQDVGGGNLRERDRWGDHDVDGGNNI